MPKKWRYFNHSSDDRIRWYRHRSKQIQRRYGIDQKANFSRRIGKSPDPSGDKLIDNPYKKWNEIDASLPNRKIRIYGPPTSSGTRDAFEELVMESLTKKMTVFTKAGFKKYSRIRQDGLYIPSGENDNLIIGKLSKDKKAIGIFGYSFLQENANKIKAITVNGVKVAPESIADGSYPISRSLFFYIKNAKKDKGITAYIELFMSDDMIGEGGLFDRVRIDSIRKNIKAKNGATSSQQTTTEIIGFKTLITYDYYINTLLRLFTTWGFGIFPP